MTQVCRQSGNQTGMWVLQCGRGSQADALSLGVKVPARDKAQ